MLRTALAAIVDARPADGLWTAADASIELWPYQLEPALAAIAGATRVLLADAVGLGKTIQAGLLLSELRERGWIEHALVVCPAGLRETWAGELSARFGIRAANLDQQAIAQRVAALPPGVNPWAGHEVAIASIDFIKRAEVMAALEGEPIDLLIVDEAHHCTPGTDRGAAVCGLASRATWCVLLSATPHSGDEAAFEYLMKIGARGEAMSVFRRGRHDAGLATTRRSHLLAVTPTAAEAALHSALDRYTRAIWRERGRHDHSARLIAVTLARRATSSGRAIERTLARRLELLRTATASPAQPPLPWDDTDDADGMAADAVLAAPGLDSPTEERACLEALVEQARQCSTSSKLLRLRRLLARVHEPVVIFTEYRDSLEAVVEALPPSRRVAAIHGGLPVHLRRSAVDAFNDGQVDVMVATDAAGEGLNLHRRCRLVVDLELPWNPLRLEQRVGRVDRLGQCRTVHAIRMFHPHTVEQRVLAHLRLRSHRAADALDRCVTETVVANAIFGDAPAEAATAIAVAGTRVESAPGEAARLERQRRARGSNTRTATGVSWVPPRPGRSSRLIALMRRRFVNDAGLIVCDAIEARVLALQPIGTRRECRRVIERARDLLLQAQPADAPPTETVRLSASRTAIRKRILAIRADLDQRVEQQASLFDRRADVAAKARRDATGALERALSRTLRAIAPPVPERTRSELIAAWPETRR